MPRIEPGTAGWEARTQNATSVVLELFCGARQVVSLKLSFPGNLFFTQGWPTQNLLKIFLIPRQKFCHVDSTLD